MKFTISTITQRFGIPVFSGVIEDGRILIGQEVEFVAQTRVFGPALICGVIVKGKSMDCASVGTPMECTIRGAGANQAKVGDQVRLRVPSARKIFKRSSL